MGLDDIPKNRPHDRIVRHSSNSFLLIIYDETPAHSSDLPTSPQDSCVYFVNYLLQMQVITESNYSVFVISRCQCILLQTVNCSLYQRSKSASHLGSEAKRRAGARQQTVYLEVGTCQKYWHLGDQGNSRRFWGWSFQSHGPQGDAASKPS